VIYLVLVLSLAWGLLATVALHRSLREVEALRHEAERLRVQLMAAVHARRS